MRARGLRTAGWVLTHSLRLRGFWLLLVCFLALLLWERWVLPSRPAGTGAGLGPLDWPRWLAYAWCLLAPGTGAAQRSRPTGLSLVTRRLCLGSNSPVGLGFRIGLETLLLVTLGQALGLLVASTTTAFHVEPLRLVVTLLAAISSCAFVVTILGCRLTRALNPIATLVPLATLEWLLQGCGPGSVASLQVACGAALLGMGLVLLVQAGWVNE